MEGSNLERFKVDPKKVRVAIHWRNEGWVVTVSPWNWVPGDVRFWIAVNKDPHRAVMAALHKAEGGQLEGLNLNGEQVYHHPMKPG